MKTEHTKSIVVAEYAGSFAENKDIARNLREEHILPPLRKGEELILDYLGVDTTTQSFTHALISQAIRELGTDVLERVFFKNCNENVQRIISIVVEYMQANIEAPSNPNGEDL